jgi:hypothetical protein
MSFHIAFDEIDALELEIVETAPFDRDRLVDGFGPSEACEAVGGPSAAHRDV